MPARKSTKSTKSSTRSKSAKSTTSTAQALTTQVNQEIQAPETAGGYLDLPSEISVTVPDFGAMIGDDLGNPESFAITPLTDAERERDAKIYREKQNRIDNYIDGAKTIGKVVSLGKELANTDKGIAEYHKTLATTTKIRGEGLKTAQEAGTAYQEYLQAAARYQQAMGMTPLVESELDAELDEKRIEVLEAQSQLKEDIDSFAARYPDINIDDIRARNAKPALPGS